MTAADTLRLERLSLQNFRCFGKCTIELHPQLTVLVAENGGGKTAVLDAIRIALGPFVDSLLDKRQRVNFEASDGRRIRGEGDVMAPVFPIEIAVDGYIDGQPIHWARAPKYVESQRHTTIRYAEPLRQAALSLRNRIVEQGEDSLTLPFIAFYSTKRLWYDRPRTEEKNLYIRRRLGRMLGYSGCLSSSSSLKGVVDSYMAMMDEVDRSLSDFTVIQLLAGVEKAIQVVLKPTEWCKLAWSWDQDWNSEQKASPQKSLWDQDWNPEQKVSPQKRLFVEHPDQGRLPPSALSDGVRTMLALVMDVALRCARLNPHLSEEASLQTPGVLLIDEVDMHLHPRWQQQIVDLLRKAFPAMQIVMTTHSPQVLSTVDKESIRIIRIRRGQALFETPQFQTRGVESADVLATIMGVDPVPHVEQAQWLSNYRALIQQHLFETTEAQTLRIQLEEHFGSQHPVLLECDRMIRLERFKQKLPSSPDQKRD
jgi:predicted ATP-binding protein involved in virulence